MTALIKWTAITTTQNAVLQAFNEENEEKILEHLSLLPEAYIVQDGVIKYWSGSFDHNPSKVDEVRLSESAVLFHGASEPGRDLLLLVLFFLTGLFALQNVRDLQQLRLTRRSFLRPMAVSLGGAILVHLIADTLFITELSPKSWVMAWLQLCLLHFSSQLYRRDWRRLSGKAWMPYANLFLILISFLTLMAGQTHIGSQSSDSLIQLQHWLLRVLSVTSIFSVLFLFILQLSASSWPIMKRSIAYLVVGGLLFLSHILPLGFIYSASVALMSVIILFMMDITADEKRFNFLWITAWSLIIAFQGTVLWMTQIDIEVIHLSMLINTFSLGFVGIMILFLLAVSFNHLVRTSWGWSRLHFPTRLLLRHKIELVTVGSLCLAFFFTGLTSYILEKDRTNDILQEQLRSIEIGAPTDFIFGQDYEIKRYLADNLTWSPKSRFDKYDLPPFQIWNRMSSMNRPVIFENEAYWVDDKTTLAAFRKSDSSFIERFGQSLISRLFNLYVFLFVLCIGLIYLISQSVSRPLALLGDQLEKISLGRANPRISWTSKDELGDLVLRYNTMLDQLDKSAEALATTERDQAWKEMAKQVAHEIKNPLTPMKLAIQHLQMKARRQGGELDDQVQKTAQTLIEQIDNMTRIAENFSKFGSMPQVANQKVLLNDVITSVHDLFRKREDMDIQCRVPIDDCFVFADKDHLIRIFNNIIKNAIQAIPRGREGHIMIQLTRKEHHAMVTITDNGQGIPDDQINKVFRPNFTTKSSGTGLGLAMCSKMIESMDGEIYFDTELDRGTTFFVKIPLLRINENYADQDVVLAG
jgi:signal transduction histidine kinase